MTALLPQPVVLGVVGLLGLLVGSFLNVVVHRVPRGLSVVRPVSACPACTAPVRPRDNLPVLSWLLLRGRCRDCGVGIPIRYPLVEAGTAVLLVALAARLDDLEVALAVLPVAAVGVALALIDLDHGRLPFALTAAAAVPATAAVLADQLGGSPQAPVWSVALGVAAWTGLHGGAWLMTSGRGMGLGDVALAPVLGLVLGALGPGPALVGLLACFGIGAAVAGGLLCTGRLARGARVPHGPFMLVGAAVGVVAGDPVARAYLAVTGLG